MQITQTALPGLRLIDSKVYEDARGHFFEAFNQSAFAAAGLPTCFAQDNQSFSRQGVLRGLHYQLEHPQEKLVRVLSGTIFDVAVDLRADSPTFGEWAGFELSAENRRMLWVPRGFAHGFLVLSESAEVFYKVTAPYHPGSERTLRWDDARVAIAWPLAGEPILSPKDATGQLWRDAELPSTKAADLAGARI